MLFEAGQCTLPNESVTMKALQLHMLFISSLKNHSPVRHADRIVWEYFFKSAFSESVCRHLFKMKWEENVNVLLCSDVVKHGEMKRAFVILLKYTDWLFISKK